LSGLVGIVEWRKHYLQVAVRPDWTDPTGIAWASSIQSIPDPPSYRTADTLNFLIDADRNRTSPFTFLLCLDEMNLARVESLLRAIFVCDGRRAVAPSPSMGIVEAVDNVEPAIDWPHNLFMFGTVNMDEIDTSLSRTKS